MVKAADHSDLCGLAQTHIHIDPSARRQYSCAHLRPIVQLINETLVYELQQTPTGLQTKSKNNIQSHDKELIYIRTKAKTNKNNVRNAHIRTKHHNSDISTQNCEFNSLFYLQRKQLPYGLRITVGLKKYFKHACFTHHYVMTLHFRFLTRQFITFHLQTETQKERNIQDNMRCTTHFLLNVLQITCIFK